MIEKHDFDYLARQVERGRILLFTGAGFSTGARDTQGRQLPLLSDVAEELWRLCFPEEPRDPTSSVQDLFEIALTRNRPRLTEYLQQRFTVDPSSVSDYFRTWFEIPWWRAYTLNVDDLEVAVRQRFRLPRDVRSLSCLGDSPRASDDRSTAGALEVVHLNGVAKSGPDGVTFSTSQYARRSVGGDPHYPSLLAELVSYPCVFVGTVLDESPLWQHIELRGFRGPRQNKELRRKSYLIARAVPRAREALLREYNVHWIPSTAEDFARAVLEKLAGSAEVGFARLGAIASSKSAASVEIPLVAEIGATKDQQGSQYLLGDEPSWSDITMGHAIERTSDVEIQRIAYSALPLSRAEPQDTPTGIGTLLVLSGTAGSGKSTALKRLALDLTAAGEEVGWVDDEVDAAPRRIERFPDDRKARVLLIDNAERYGGELGSIVAAVLRSGRVRLLGLGIRAANFERLISGPRLEGITVREIAIPPLSDPDIEKLLRVLSTHNLLGQLKGLSAAAQMRIFREKADRQLLVAMIEATSGRRFEEKVFEEWAEMSPPEKEAYGLVALAYWLGHATDKEQILVASGDAGNELLNSVDGLLRRHVIRETTGGQIRARHRLIADVLVNELMGQQREFLLKLYMRLAFAAAVRVRPAERRSGPAWRMVKSILNHERLYRLFEYRGACSIYDEVGSVLDWDYHYFLQRGSLELEYGQIRLAENFLEQARSLEDRDPRVVTAYGYMLLKRASLNPESPRASELARNGVDILLDQIRERGIQDPYPYHVLGSQGLAWSRKARLGEGERAAFLKLLVRQIGDGLGKHPRQQDLKQLYDDVKREELSLAVPKGKGVGKTKSD